jgi:hypothetical protein
MKRSTFLSLLLGLPATISLSSCSDFLSKQPLDQPSTKAFWKTEDQARMWVNNLYNSLGNSNSSDNGDPIICAFSDDAFGRAGQAANKVANGSFDATSNQVEVRWNYHHIRLCLSFFEHIDKVPNVSKIAKDRLSGQVNFLLAYNYHRLARLYGDIPFFKKPLTIAESDIKVSSKSDVVKYVLTQLDMAIKKLPVAWPNSETGRITKGAALSLKARVLLYNNRWSETAQVAKKVMDLNIYELYPSFGDLFKSETNNKTKEVILAYEYANKQRISFINRYYAPVSMGGYALVLPTNELQASFRMKDGLPIGKSPMYDDKYPFLNRDSRYYDTFLWHGQKLNGAVLDLTTSEYSFAITYIYFRKYIEDLKNHVWQSHTNWILFRYADVLLMYAEAKNEASGPEPSIYDALDLIRKRAGMPDVNRNKYSDQDSLRQLIRNERRVELAGEGLRYMDIIRWRIAENVLNIDLKSMDLASWAKGPIVHGKPKLVQRPVETRVFDSAKDYVWPIPQKALDDSTNLKQHPEWA